MAVKGKRKGRSQGQAQSKARVVAKTKPKATARAVVKAKPKPNSRAVVRGRPKVAVTATRDEREARARLETAVKVAEVEQRVHIGINAERVRNGKSPLRWDERLAAVARAHSDDMTSRRYFSHDTPEGLGPSDRINRAGYRCWKSTHFGIAENIAIETTLGNLDQSAAKAVRGWMNSRGHRANLLGKQYDRTGIGASFGTWRGYKAVYLTQVFC